MLAIDWRGCRAGAFFVFILGGSCEVDVGDVLVL